MPRMYRELDDATKQKISQSQKERYRQMSNSDLRKKNNKIANSLRSYWKTIPNKSENGNDNSLF